MTNATVDGAIATSPLTVLVNGASRGIGLAAVQHLLADPTIGCVFATSRNATSSEALATLANQAQHSAAPNRSGHHARSIGNGGRCGGA